MRRQRALEWKMKYSSKPKIRGEQYKLINPRLSVKSRSLILWVKLYNPVVLLIKLLNQFWRENISFYNSKLRFFHKKKKLQSFNVGALEALFLQNKQYKTVHSYNPNFQYFLQNFQKNLYMKLYNFDIHQTRVFYSSNSLVKALATFSNKTNHCFFLLQFPKCKICRCFLQVSSMKNVQNM